MVTIYKKGTFESAHLLKGHPKCGKLHGHSYKYEVTISSSNLVKPYDFVLDFHAVSDYFKQFDHSDIIIKYSCEVMVMKAVQHFHSLLKKQHTIKVKIWETATSYGECEQTFNR